MSQLLITTPHVAQYADPIAFEAGDSIEVGKCDLEFPEWHWCRNQQGKEGWVHHNFLSAREGIATGVRSYDSKEITVKVDDVVTLLESVGGWLLVKGADGSVGWLPESHTTTI